MSLVPSATETLLEWGVSPVAVTRFCEQGDRFATVGGTKDPRVEAIVALSPDVVVMCDQENRREDADALVAAGIAIHVLHITDVAHVGPEMSALAAAVGVDPSVGAACGITPAPAVPNYKRAYIPIWKRPWMTVRDDTYGATVLASIGLHTVATGHADRYPELDLEQARALGAEVVIATSEPYPFAERHRAILETVAPVVFVDGRDVFWWGARTPTAQARIAAAVEAALA